MSTGPRGWESKALKCGKGHLGADCRLLLFTIRNGMGDALKTHHFIGTRI